MSDSRDRIFARLEKSSGPKFNIEPIDEYRPVVSVDDKSSEALRELFIQNAERLACLVYQVVDENEAIQTVIDLLKDAEKVSTWAQEEIPLPGLFAELDAAGITFSTQDNPRVRYGITGANAAIAAIGSLVLASGLGRFRAPSILPPKHIAILESSKIFASLESWLSEQRKSGIEELQKSSNIVLISGPSRTADIAMELVMGMHGPKELHIILLP